MSRSLIAEAGAARANSVGVAVVDENVLLRLDFKAACESRKHTWKQDALAAEMSRASGLSIGPGDLSKLKSGDRPLSIAHLLALPDDVQREFERLRAKRSGLLVAEPLTGEAGREAFVAGLLSLLTPEAK